MTARVVDYQHQTWTDTEPGRFVMLPNATVDGLRQVLANALAGNFTAPSDDGRDGFDDI